MRRTLWVLLLLAGSLGWLVAQGAAQPAKLGIRGSITKADPATDEVKKKGLLGTVLIEGPKNLNPNSDKASVKITEKTRLEIIVGGERKVATFADLKVGAKVEAIFVGPVAESYPVQATAGELLIVPDKK